MASSQTQQVPRSSLAGRFTVRRSVTVPSKLQTVEPKPAVVEIGAAEGIETLFVHPSARIVSFTTSSFATSSPTRRPSDTGGAGSLSWRSPTERTLAAGLLEIYRVPGSVSFLHSGSLLHAILPRSQCWCVDGISVFTLRVLPNQYYRIELPGVTEQDLALVEELKVTLQKVLHYERTACPFQRGFSVDLPEAPQRTPRRKSRNVSEPAKKWKLNGVWRPENEDDWEPEKPSEGSPELEKEPQDAQTSSSGEAGDAPSPEAQWKSSDDESDMETPRPRRPSNLRESRSVTAPPKLTLIASPPSKSATPTSGNLVGQPLQDAPASCAAGALDTGKSIHSAAAEPSDTATDFGQPKADSKTVVLQVQTDALQENIYSPVSQASVGILSEDDTVEGRIWSAISTPSLSSDSEGHSWGEIKTPPETLRIRKSRNPPRIDKIPRASSQSSINRRGSRESQTALTDGIVRKTVGIFLGPPSHLVSMMLKIAAKISNGAFSFTVRSPLGTPQRVPGSWYLAEDEDEWDIDDYGFPVGLPGSAQKRALSRARESNQ